MNRIGIGAEEHDLSQISGIIAIGLQNVRDGIPQDHRIRKKVQRDSLLLPQNCGFLHRHGRAEGREDQTEQQKAADQLAKLHVMPPWMRQNKPLPSPYPGGSAC